MNIFDKNFKEILSSELISIIGGLFAGIILAIYTENIFVIPGMLIILPGFLELKGNISGSFSARLSSGLFLKIIDPNKYNTKQIRQNIIASLFLSIFVCLILGFIAFLVNYILFGIYYYKIILIPIIAGIISNIIELPITLFLTFYIFRKGYDPNNIVGPLLTTIGDFVSVIALLFTIFIV